MFQSLSILLASPKNTLKKKTSPLLVALTNGVDPNSLSSSPPPATDDLGSTALHWVAEMGDPNDTVVLKNQVVLAKQLIKAGANVNAKAYTGKLQKTPLHVACFSGTVTNFKLIRLLLDNGADPNIPNSIGETPLMYTIPHAMGAAKLLLQHKGLVDIDVNMKLDDGSTFLGAVRHDMRTFQFFLSIRDSDEDLLRLKQLREVEELLIAKGAIDGGWRGSRTPS